ncbi:allophanate hydrolase, partial [Salmonella enterica]
ANLLVGNDEGAAVLELTMLGPELAFRRDAVIAVTGAVMTPKLDGVAQACNTALAVRAGQVLSFDFLKGGARAYLAVAGGIDVPT